jgi:hypothetical protein
MAYNLPLADRLREYLADRPHLVIEEKEMFRGLTFMINGKMCVSVSGDNLMCRFDPAQQEELASRKGYQPMRMKSREYRGYCYVSAEGYTAPSDFAFWVNLCLDFNGQAKAAKKKKKS